MSSSPGTIGVVSAELTRFASFGVSLLRTAMPPGTTMSWIAGVSVAENLNITIRGVQGDWLWLLGDDHEWAPDALERLLAHEVDIVAPLVTTRKPPIHPVMFQEGKPGELRAVQWSELPASGLVRVAAAGTAGMLIRRHVLEKLTNPWFEIGKTRADVLGEDLYFCQKARQAGFQIHVDVDTLFGHTTPVTLWPRRLVGGWGLGLDMDHGLVLEVPIV